MQTELSKKFYKIKEVSELLGIPQSTLRYWEQEFPQLDPSRSLHNRRYYTPADIETVQIIKFLIKTKGYKIEAAREQLNINRKNLSKRIEIIEKLNMVREDLSQMLQSLNLRAGQLGIPEENSI